MALISFTPLDQSGYRIEFSTNRGKELWASDYAGDYFSSNMKHQVLILMNFDGSVKATLTLNAQESCRIKKICYNLRGEHHSNYRFSKQLEQVYLCELIHQLIKLSNKEKSPTH